jgi:hypothetical protein
MNSARPPEEEASAPGTGAAILASACAIGDLPSRKDTVRAEVLSRLLCGERMTGMEGVFKASTTRLSAVIHAFECQYGWGVDRRDKVVGSSDGRIPTICEYWLSPDVIELAAAADAGAWCAEVRAARRALRAQAADAKRTAAKANARRTSPPYYGQGDLFGGDGGSI